MQHRKQLLSKTQKPQGDCAPNNSAKLTQADVKSLSRHGNSSCVDNSSMVKKRRKVRRSTSRSPDSRSPDAGDGTKAEHPNDVLLRSNMPRTSASSGSPSTGNSTESAKAKKSWKHENGQHDHYDA